MPFQPGDIFYSSNVLFLGISQYKKLHGFPLTPYVGEKKARHV